MKKLIYLLFTPLLVLSSGQLLAQDNADSTGLPGDNFDLQGAMELFKSSGNPEDFEKALNTESNYVNNLDLDGDGETDYILVNDRVDGKSHAVVMQIAVNESEMQDVAVILIEQTGDSTAQLQIVGNETLYGDELVMEPYDEVSEETTSGPSTMMSPMRIVVVNVWAWPSVRFIYRPVYVPYVSPWRWHVYPVWWRPWRPVYWHAHRARVHHYHVMYHVAPVCHLKKGHTIYVKHKTISKTVTVKYAAPQANYQAKKASASKNNAGAQGKTNASNANKAKPTPSEAGKGNATKSNQQKSTNESGKTTAKPAEKNSQRSAGKGQQSQQKTAPAQKRSGGGSGPGRRR